MKIQMEKITSKSTNQVSRDTTLTKLCFVVGYCC